ncbi:MAG: thioesterase family protein [Pseudomonas sp.]
MLLPVYWRKPVDPLGTTSLRMTVLPNDLDFNGHVNNGRYLTLAGVGRMDFVIRSGTARVAIAQRARPIVGDAMAKFCRNLKPFERFDLQTRLLGWDEKWIFIEHRFVRHGRVLGIVVVRGLFKAPSGPVKPSVFAAVLGVSAVSPQLPSWVAEWNRSGETLSNALRLEEQTAEPNPVVDV